MTFEVYYDPFKSMSGLTLFQTFSPSSKLAMTNVRCSLVLLNGVSLSNIKASIFAYNGSAPSKLIVNSEVRQQSEFTDISNGYYDVSFDFPGEAWLNKAQIYALGISADAYTFTESSHAGWVRDWPEPNYDQDLAMLNPGRSPYRFHVAGKRYFGV